MLNMQRSLTLMTIVWTGLMTVGFVIWKKFDTTPGPKSSLRVVSAHQESTDQLKMILFVHPYCPCTKSSVEALLKLLPKKSIEAGLIVEFVRPIGLPVGWERSKLWIEASSIPGVIVRCDADGVYARQLGVTTSGHLIVWNPQGKCVFSGGITPARGWSGMSAGQKSLSQILEGVEPEICETPVYGCPLFETIVNLPVARRGVECLN